MDAGPAPQNRRLSIPNGKSVRFPSTADGKERPLAFPILPAQPRDAAEFLHIVCDQHQVIGQRHGRDEQIVRADQFPRAMKIRANSPIVVRGAVVERDAGERGKEGFQQTQIRLDRLELRAPNCSSARTTLQARTSVGASWRSLSMAFALRPVRIPMHTFVSRRYGISESRPSL